MSHDTLLDRFNQLDPQAQDQLLAFWDFLLTRSARTPVSVMKPAYREQIQQVSRWTEEDLQPIEEAAARWQWKVSSG